MYSQSDEERYILEAVGSEVGTFLDIGAYDGFTFSNTLALIERGWSGVMVEPSPYALASLVDRHGKNKKITLVQALVGFDRDLHPFWITRDALSTTNKDRHERWKDSGNFTSCVLVPQILLIDLPVHESVDVVSIDTEGTSYRIFYNWPFHLCRPKVFCVEYDEHQGAIEFRATEQNYNAVYRSDENLVLVRGN